MASEREMVAEQRKQLFQLLVLHKAPKELKSFTTQLIAVMDKEDVAYIRELVDEFLEEKGDVENG
ncbi:MAG: hypothetical protein FWG65_02150 [Turicibacter sp.]|nr:hypothetical protein [Turicibacter sp.]